MDLESLDKWEAYTEAKEEMFLRTDTDHAPWYTVRSNDKKRARVNALRLFLSLIDYDGKDEQVVLQPDANLVRRGREAVGDERVLLGGVDAPVGDRASRRRRRRWGSAHRVGRGCLGAVPSARWCAGQHAGRGPGRRAAVLRRRGPW